MSWIGHGIFRPLLHELDDQPKTMVIRERRYWLSRCVSACITLPAETDFTELPHCADCFPDGIPADYFTHGDGAILNVPGDGAILDVP